MDEAFRSMRFLADDIRVLSATMRVLRTDLADKERNAEKRREDSLKFHALREKIPILELQLDGLRKRMLQEHEEHEASLRETREVLEANAARLREQAERENADLRENAERERSELIDKTQRDSAALRAGTQRESDELHGQLDASNRQVQKLEEELIKTKAIREALAARGEELSCELAALKIHFSDARGEADSAHSEAVKLKSVVTKIETEMEGKIRLLREEKEALEIELSNLKPELAGVRAQLQGALDETKREQVEFEKERDRLAGEVERLVKYESDLRAEEFEVIPEGGPAGAVPAPGDSAAPARVPVKESRPFEELKGWASGLSHQMRNNLGVIASTSQFCLDCLDIDIDVRERLEMIKKNAGEATSVVDEFTRMSRPVEADPVRGSLNEFLEDLAGVILERCHERGIGMVKDFPAVLGEALLDQSLLEEAMLCIVENALEAMPQTGALKMSARRSEGGEEFEILLIDSGTGMGAEERGKALDPFFSTKDGRLGLGLCIARRNIEAQGASLRLESVPEKGTTVIVRIPAGCRGADR